MVGTKSLSALLMAGVLAASVSPSAFAGGRYHGGGGGNGLAIAAGILGAVAVGTIIANSAQQPVYEAPPQRAYYGPPPQQVYYQQSPQYYQAPPQPVYVQYPRDAYYYRGGYYQR